MLDRECYARILRVLGEWGPRIAKATGQVADIGVRKEWLTEFDLAVERALAAEISSFGSDHVLFAEEEHDVPRCAKHLWVADPISGTQNFVRGLPACSLVVSHLEDGVPQFAAVLDPVRQELFTAIRGDGLRLNGQSIVRPACEERVLLNFQPSSHWLTDEEAGELFATLGRLGMVRISGLSEGLQYAYGAAGRFSGCCVTNHDVFPAHAGRLLIEEAGGRFSDFDGNPLGWEPRGVIAGAPMLQERLLEMLRGTLRRPFYESVKSKLG